mgnify:CR=1
MVKKPVRYLFKQDFASRLLFILSLMLINLRARGKAWRYDGITVGAAVAVLA